MPSVDGSVTASGVDLGDLTAGVPLLPTHENPIPVAKHQNVKTHRQ